MILQIETTNICNAHCVFCSRVGGNQIMDGALFRKVVDETKFDGVRLSLLGEPFCDPQIMERIEYIKGDVELFTNGSLITYDQIDRLANLGNVKVKVSLNGASQKTRRKMMGLDDYEDVLAKYRYMRRRLLCSPSLVWHPVLGMDEMREFIKFDDHEICVWDNDAGNLYSYRRTFPTKCPYFLNVVNVTVDGDVILCCHDVNHKVVFGNLRKKSLSDIHKSELYLSYYRAHVERRGEELQLCRECTTGVQNES